MVVKILVNYSCTNIFPHSINETLKYIGSNPFVSQKEKGVRLYTTSLRPLLKNYDEFKRKVNGENMENYIFYCYKKWRQKREGSIFKQISGLTIGAIFLLVLLLGGLIGFFVILGYSIADVEKVDSTFILILAVAYTMLCVIASIYSENYQVKHSKKGLKNYKKYCKNMKKKVLINHGIPEEFIPTLIERYNAMINGIDEKIKSKHEHFNKFFEMLLIPISVIILGALLDKGINATETLGLGLSGTLIILIIYAIAFFVLYLYDFVMRFPQSKYREFVTDLQSILDFKKCKTVNESEGDVAVPSSTENTQGGSAAHT